MASAGALKKQTCCCSAASDSPPAPARWREHLGAFPHWPAENGRYRRTRAPGGRRARPSRHVGRPALRPPSPAATPGGRIFLLGRMPGQSPPRRRILRDWRRDRCCFPAGTIYYLARCACRRSTGGSRRLPDLRPWRWRAGVGVRRASPEPPSLPTGVRGGGGGGGGEKGRRELWRGGGGVGTHYPT